MTTTAAHIATAHSFIFSNMGKWKNWGDALTHFASIADKQVTSELRWILNKAQIEGEYYIFSGRIPYAMGEKLKNSFDNGNIIIDGDKVWTVSLDWGKYVSNGDYVKVTASYDTTESYFNYFA